MLQPAKDLGFLPEALHNLPRRRTGTNDLQRHAASGILLLRLVHRAHATLADDSDDAIGGDALRRRSVSERMGLQGRVQQVAAERGLVQYSRRMLVGVQQPAQFQQQGLVTRTLFAQEVLAVGSTELRRGAKQRLNALEVAGHRHDAPPSPSWRYNHARASRHSSAAVDRAMPST